MTANEQAVAEALAAYSGALNASDTDAVMPLCAEDGVFMPPYSASAVGAHRGKRMMQCSKAIELTVKFNVAEIVEMSAEWVFARTNSAGTTRNHATGATSAEANQELLNFLQRPGRQIQKCPLRFFHGQPTEQVSRRQTSLRGFPWAR
jgi:ketosteroid isomerase-like protein